MSNESALARSTVLAPSVVGVEPRRWCSGSVSRFRWVCWSTVSNCPARPIYQPCWGVHGHAARGVVASLRQQGLIETRRVATGSFVRSAAGPTKAALERRLAAFTVSQLRDAGDELTAISGAVARLASSRASNDSIRRLSVLAQRLLTANGAAQRARTDSRFPYRGGRSCNLGTTHPARRPLCRRSSAACWVARLDRPAG